MKPLIGLLSVVVLCAQAQTVTIVSAASYTAPVAPDSIAVAFGSGLAASEARAGSVSLPTTLGETTVTVTDSAGVGRMAALYLVSPGQVNFVVPAGTAAGPATVTVTSGGRSQTATVRIATVAPGIFTANEDGKGVAAAIAIRRVIATNLQTELPVFLCANGPGTCASVPLGLGVDTPVYLTLFGTGFRGHSSLGIVTCTIGGETVPVLFADAQPQYPGLDQVNVPVVLGLRGKGEVDVVLTVDGQPANTVRVNVQ